MRLLFLLGILILHIVAFNAEEPKTAILPSTTSDEPINPLLNAKYQSSPQLRQQALSRVINSSNWFSSKLVKEVAKINSGNNVISPLGLSLTLSMASYGAQGSFETVFRNALGLSSSKYQEKIGFQALIDDLANYTAVKLYVANGVFVSSKIHPRSEFIEDTTRAFRSAVQRIEFEKSIEASNIISEWCEKNTHRLIKNIIKPGDVNADTGLALVNAVYFKGTWLRKFDVARTRERSFHVDDVTEKQVPTMSIEGSFNFGVYPEAKATFVELPYKTQDDAHKMSMFIILPNERNGLADLEKNLQRITVQELINRGSEEKVNIQLPKFRIESEIDLKEPLTRMGMDLLFDPSRTNFRGIVESPQLFLSKVVQKAIIEINEEGSEAAGASGVVITSRSFFPEDPIYFLANHPFYVIIATTGANPLNVFTARFTG